MELTYNNGNAFFSIDSPDFVGATKDLKNVNRLIANDVVSFSITEEVGKLLTGTLSLRDPNWVYSRILRTGLKFNISFGYKKWNENVLAGDRNSSTGTRQGLKCVCMTPSGNGSSKGETRYNISFYGLEFLDRKVHKVFDRGTRKSMIQNILADMDVAESYIDFPDMNSQLKKSYSVRQRESNFTMLNMLAKEYKATFVLGYRPTGSKVALFIDTRNLDSAQAQSYMKGVSVGGKEKALYYNSGQLSNVQSYNWSQNIGENGQGDGTSISIIGGKPVFTKFVVEGGNVKLWRFVPKKVSDHINEQGSSSDKFRVTGNILSAKTFKELERYFDPVDQPFAPQGEGFTINAKIVGDPRITALTRIKFKSGFAAPLMQAENINALVKFYVKRVTHSFNKSEFSTSLDIVDTVTLNGSYIAPATIEESINQTGP